MHTQLLPSKLMQFYLHSQHPFLIACLWEPAPASPLASKAEQNKEWPLFFLIQIQRKFAYVSGCESSMTSMSLGLLGLWILALERAFPVSVKVFWVGQVFLRHKYLLCRILKRAREKPHRAVAIGVTNNSPSLNLCLYPLWGSTKRPFLLCTETSG